MNKIVTFATCLLMAGCGTQNKESNKGIDPNDFDNTVDLKEDFYQHVTGGWQKNHPLKPEYARYGAFDLLAENNTKRIQDLFSSILETTNEKGSINDKIAILYRQGLDSVALNENGFNPIKADIEQINNLSTREDVIDEIVRLQKSTCSPFFRFGVGPDMMNSDSTVFGIGQGGLGMGNRDYYLKEENEHIREAYKNYILKVAGLIGMDETSAETFYSSIIGIEMELAQASLSNVELRNPYNSYHIVDKASVLKQYPNMQWERFFEGLGVTMPEKIDVNHPDFFQKVNELLGKTDVNTLKNYLLFSAVNGAMNYMSDEFSATAFDFYGKTMTGAAEQKPRWKRATGVADNLLSEAVGQIYVAKYFPEENKAKMLHMVSNLQKSLGQHIAALTWMTDSTKAKAEEKLSNFKVKIGYPDKWKDYSSLNISDECSYLDNIKAASNWYVQDELSKLGKPVDKSEWGMSPQTVNAYYNPTTNEICFPAAILQPPFFDANVDDAVNYGAIGVVIGHEMTHGFDDQGRLFDKNGNLNNWWSEEDAKNFEERTAILVNQFNAITVLDTLKADGKYTLGENIADQGGLRVAYTALQEQLKETPAKEIDGFTPEQRFYLSYARLWAQNVRDAEIIRLTKNDVHSLGKWRVNGTLRNIQEFYDAFNLTDGSMYMAPEDRVVIW